MPMQVSDQANDECDPIDLITDVMTDQSSCGGSSEIFTLRDLGGQTKHKKNEK